MASSYAGCRVDLITALVSTDEPFYLITRGQLRHGKRFDSQQGQFVPTISFMYEGFNKVIDYARVLAITSFTSLVDITMIDWTTGKR